MQWPTRRNTPVLFFCLLLTSYTIRAQRPINDAHRADSLQQLLAVSTSDTARAGLLQSLSNYWLYRDSAKAMQYAQQSLRAATKAGNVFYTGMAHFFTGNVYMEHGNLPQAEQELMTAERILRPDTSRQSLRYQARIWHNYGAICQRRDDSEQFLDVMLHKTAPLLERAGDSLTLALTYKDVGMVLMNYGQYDKALEYYNKTIRQFGNDIGFEELANCYSYAAQTLVFKEDYKNARVYLDKAAQILSRNTGSQEWILFYTVNGMWYYYQNKPEQALESYSQGLAMAEKWKQLYPSLNLLMGKYKVYASVKDYGRAREILYQLHDKTAAFPISQNKLRLLKDLAFIEEKTNHIPRAYQWLQQYSDLSDSLNEANGKVKISELETKYQAAKKEKEILTLQDKSRQQQLVLAHNRLTNYLLASGVVILLLLLLLVYLQYRNKKRLAQEQQLAHAQELKELEREQQLLVYNAMLKGQEQERNRVARDLHDGLGGMLAGVKLKLSAIAGNNEMQQTDMELYKVISQLDNSVQELRRIARDMMPETLLQYGLEPALKDLCASLQTPGLQPEFQGYGISKTIPAMEQVAIFRIVQELLTNAIRHAQAKHILVQCSQNGSVFFITVEDDGTGFNQAAGDGLGIGLGNVRNRVNYLRGKIDIQSVPGEGTTVNIEVNVHE